MPACSLISNFQIIIKFLSVEHRTDRRKIFRFRFDVFSFKIKDSDLCLSVKDRPVAQL